MYNAALIVAYSIAFVVVMVVVGSWIEDDLRS